MALPEARQLSSTALAGDGFRGQGDCREKGGSQLDAGGSVAIIFLPCRHVQILPLLPPSQVLIEALLWARHQGNQDGSFLQKAHTLVGDTRRRTLMRQKR